jgi:hypothetical protein
MIERCDPMVVAATGIAPIGWEALYPDGRDAKEMTTNAPTITALPN